ncbi:MAG: hypothetical protein EKK54_06045 [Neisseriaceae bacterium]|nr:MAG: hypothetical protein EKK54_06045 [Neisseriaceae bacterium]
MKKFLMSTMIILPILINGCSAGGDSSSNSNYYSSGYDYYYQLQAESSSTPVLNALSANGTTLFSANLTPGSSNSYTFKTTYNNKPVAGNVVLSNGILSIAASNWGIDLASNSTTQVSNGTFSTICDMGNMSPCTIIISGNNITVTEYASNGRHTQLCNNSLLSTTNAIPNNYSFKCGINGSSTPQYDWYLIPFIRNGVAGLLLGEFNYGSQVNNDQTNDIAMQQTTTVGEFMPNGSYYYASAYSGTPSMTVATITYTGSNALINNPTVGSCNGQPCSLIMDQYYQQIAYGYAYFTPTQPVLNVNVVGNSNMGLMMDSVSGFYVQ